MTVSLNLANIAHAISQLSITGVTVKDVHGIAGDWTPLPNVLYPKPDGWVTGFGMEYVSFPQGTNGKIDIKYVLNYRFLGTQVGDISTFPVAYNDLVDKIILIINALIGLDAPYSGSVMMDVAGVDIAPLTDPAGNNFFGADITLNITEMQNP